MYGDSTDGCLLPSLSIIQIYGETEIRNTIEMNRNGTWKGQQKMPWKYSASVSAPWTQTRCSCGVDGLRLRRVWSLVSILKLLKICISCSKIQVSENHLHHVLVKIFSYFIHVYICAECACGAHESQKRESDPMKPELPCGC